MVYERDVRMFYASTEEPPTENSGVTDNNRRARFYAITAAGRRQLAVEKQEWNRTVTIMQALLSESK
jgi:DNA-binding PadR family transcriptional regulator